MKRKDKRSRWKSGGVLLVVEAEEALITEDEDGEVIKDVEEEPQASIKSYKSHKMGHFKNKCPDAHYAEMEEDVLLMAHVDIEKKTKEEVWFLDSGCSNHMFGRREWFVDFDQTYNQHVKLEDNKKMRVEGRGNLRLVVNGVAHVITDVYYVSKLRNNLLSVEQFQQKGLRVIIEDDVCEIWHKQHKRLLMVSNMTKNRMFIILVTVKNKGGEESNFLQATKEEVSDL